MGIRIHKGYYAVHSVTENAVEPEYMGWKKEKLEEYMKEHPFPVDTNYSKEDAIYDLTESGGALTFTEDLTESTIEYLEEMMNALGYP